MNIQEFDGWNIKVIDEHEKESNFQMLKVLDYYRLSNPKIAKMSDEGALWDMTLREIFVMVRDLMQADANKLPLR